MLLQKQAQLNTPATSFICQLQFNSMMIGSISTNARRARAKLLLQKLITFVLLVLSTSPVVVAYDFSLVQR
jgi:hypothetical protein